jgi:hypothetical protein
VLTTVQLVDMTPKVKLRLKAKVKHRLKAKVKHRLKAKVKHRLKAKVKHRLKAKAKLRLKAKKPLNESVSADTTTGRWFSTSSNWSRFCGCVLIWELSNQTPSAVLAGGVLLFYG